MSTLKRFTQCGSLTMLFGVFIVLFGVSSTALTTFGKAPPPPPPPPAAKGNPCSSNNDCGGILYTSCVADPDDKIDRCLCGDNSTPVNGFCNKTQKKFRHKCEEDIDCEGELVCVLISNTTKTTGFNRSPAVAVAKLCQCPERVDEFDDNCNGALQMAQGILIPLLSVIFGLLFSKKS